MYEVSKYRKFYLNELKPGQTASIKFIEGNKDFMSSLVKIGIAPGNSITVVSGGYCQPYIIDFAGSRVALAWSMCSKIIVEVKNT